MYFEDTPHPMKYILFYSSFFNVHFIDVFSVIIDHTQVTPGILMLRSDFINI